MMAIHRHDAFQSKVKDLEREFVSSFERLARKEDIKLSARINPKSFSVEIIRDKNHLVDKNELSAGEKQIYAISILEALARTSGRKLPIIIDTPLGRLDSKHRNKLIRNYFPNASHQVIILSTDTEVDEDFYSELSKSISHAYRLDYDPATASTVAKEGYFWKNEPAFKEVV
jgi:DNA sulfur modification protein DndD